MALQAKAMANQLTAMDLLTRLSTGGQLDDRDRIMFKDNIKNLMTQGNSSSQLALPDPDGDLKTVSDIAIRDGHGFTTKDIKTIGSIAAANYRERYGEDAKPKKQEQFVLGRACPVNTYSTKDHDLVRAAIRDYQRD